MPDLLHGAHLHGFAVNFPCHIVPDRANLVFVICQRQPDRSADLSQPDNGNFDGHALLIFSFSSHHRPLAGLPAGVRYANLDSA